MTKSGIERLEERVDRIMPSNEPEVTDEMEEQALQAWIWVHLTEEEDLEAVR